LSTELACHGSKLTLTWLATKKQPFHTFRPNNMARSPSTFRQTDVTKALKAVNAAGYSAARVLIDKDGRLEIITAAVKPDDSSDNPDNEWDDIK
jgi:hypothetical protein